MQLALDASIAEWLSRAAPFLQQAEAENNLLLGLAAQAVGDPERYGPFPALTRVTDGHRTVGAALVNPFNLILSRQHDEALSLVAAHLATAGVLFPGVLGPDDVPERFVGMWRARTGAQTSLRQRQRIHECRRVEPLAAARGHCRPPVESEVAALAAWREDFHSAVNAAAVDDDAAAAVRRMMERGDLLVWEDAGTIVSCAATARRTPRGTAIAFVYTPPEQRGRGYATSCVAELTRRSLAAGADFCCLYTDLANPVSNAIYARIGYRRVCDSAWWQIDG
jgi:predicted GNAT family acetyltransferase